MPEAKETPWHLQKTLRLLIQHTTNPGILPRTAKGQKETSQTFTSEATETIQNLLCENMRMNQGSR